MTNQDGKAAHARRSVAGDGAARPGDGSNPALDRDRARGQAQAEVELCMADLIGDANDTIVFFNDSGVRTVALCTEASVVADGRAERRVTAAGADVSGFKYLTFDNGLTLYYDSGIDLVVRRPPKDASR